MDCMPNVNGKTRLLEEFKNILIILGQRFIKLDTKIINNKRKDVYIGLHKNQCFLVFKGHHLESGKANQREDVYNNTSDQKLISLKYKEPQQINRKKTDNPINMNK